MDATLVSDAAEREVDGAALPSRRVEGSARASAVGLRLATAASVLLPLGLLAWVAANSVLSFDGGMNLAVSDGIAHGRGFAWNYGSGVTSPSLVQTSGLFLLVGAVAIKLFGTGALALQLANLTFLGLLLATISVSLRPWPVVRLVGPLAFVLMTPGVMAYGLAGYGEYAVGFLMAAAFLLLNAVSEQAPRPLVLCSAASALIGISLSIKSVTLAELPVFVAGLALVAYCRPELSKIRLGATALIGVLPVVAFEAYRAVELGSVSGWAHYWKRQVHGIHHEAAASTFDRPGLANAGKGWPRIDRLAEQIGVQVPALVVAWLVLPLAVLLASYLRRPGSARDWLAQPRLTFEVLLGGVVALYIPWYVLVSPVDWLRHLEVGVIALGILYLLLACRLLDARRERVSSPRQLAARRTIALVAVAAAAIGAVLCIGRTAVSNTHDLAAPSSATLHAEQAAAHYVAQLHAHGATVCGQGSISAPVIGLTSHAALCDLDALDRCDPDLQTAFRHGAIYLIWDSQASIHDPAGPPPSAVYLYTKSAQPSSYASIWRVSLRNDAC